MLKSQKNEDKPKASAWSDQSELLCHPRCVPAQRGVREKVQNQEISHKRSLHQNSRGGLEKRRGFVQPTFAIQNSASCMISASEQNLTTHHLRAHVGVDLVVLQDDVGIHHAVLRRGVQALPVQEVKGCLP